MSIIHCSVHCKSSALLLAQDSASPSALIYAPLKSVAAVFSCMGEIFHSNRSLGSAVTHHSMELLESEKVDRRSLVKVIFTCMAIAAALGLIKYVRHLTVSEETKELQDASSVNALTTALAVTSAQVGRRLLSFSIQSLLPNLVATEEVPFSNQQYVWDIFKNTDGSHQFVSAKQSNGLPLPSGVSVINQLMHFVSSTPLQVYGSCIAYSKGYAFIGTNDLIMIFDVSNSLNPIKVSTISALGTKGLIIAGNFLYILDSSEDNFNRLRVIDVSNPHNPIVKGFCDIEQAVPISLSASFIHLGNFIYIGTEGTTTLPTTLEVINVLDPTNPTPVRSVSLSLAGLQYLGHMMINNNNTICYGASNLGFHSFDVSNPSSPAVLGFMKMFIGGLAASNDNNIVFAATSNGIQVIDVSNPSSPKVYSIVSNGSAFRLIKTAGNFLFIIAQNILLQKYDVTNPRNPILVSSMLSGEIKDLALSQTNVLAVPQEQLNDIGSLAIGTLGDLFSITGIAAPQTQGNYSIDLTATSSSGNVTETVNLEINPAVTLKTTIPPQIAIVNSNFNYFVQAFEQVNNAPLTYTAKLINGSLPNWLALNPISGTLSGTPTATDTGTLNLQLIAKDPAGASALADCQIRVLHGPTLNSAIANQFTTIGNPYNFTLNAHTFSDRDGYQLTFAATSNGGALPSWLTFNPSTQTFSGVPSLQDGGVVTITVTAEDPNNIPMATNFQLNIVAELPPTLFNPISNQVATVGKAFKFIIPKETFTDAYADEVTYSVKPSDGSSFPAWLSYDPASRTFSGTPGYGDTNSFADRILLITLSAKGLQASQSTTFTLNVTGTSSAALALLIAGPLATVASISYTAYKIRYLFWNTFRKAKYQKPADTAIIGKPYERKLSIPSEEIGAVEALQNNKKFPPEQLLPHWLYFDHKNNSLKSDCIPADEHLEAPICLRIVDHQGFNREEFDLHIKDESESPLIAEEKVARSSKDAGARLKKRNDSIGSHYIELSEV